MARRRRRRVWNAERELQYITRRNLLRAASQHGEHALDLDDSEWNLIGLRVHIGRPTYRRRRAAS